MRLGMQLGITNTLPKPISDTLIQIAEQADQAGFATLTVPDHFSLRPESTPWLSRTDGTPLPAVTEFYEAWSVLAFMAARTTQIRFSTIVSGITMRYPAVLVKMVDTLDALSNGRAYLGLGASPDFGADEHLRMGLPFPAPSERVARLEEVLQLALQMWSGADKPFAGTYYQLASTVGNPVFVQRPHPPILIAGSGAKMLRLMAQYADAISIGFGRDLDDLQAKLAVVRGHCQALNRPYEQIAKTTLFTTPLVQNGQVDLAALDMLRALAALGIDEVMIGVPSDLAAFHLFATDVIPTVANIPVAGRS